MQFVFIQKRYLHETLFNTLHLYALEVIQMLQSFISNLEGFCASMNPRFEGGILDFMDGIPDFMKNFNTS